MIDIFIDFSVFSETSAIGRVSGELKVPFQPCIGDTISFSFPDLELSSLSNDGFSGICVVESRILVPGEGFESVSFCLSSMHVRNSELAISLMKSLVSTYNLFIELY